MMEINPKKVDSPLSKSVTVEINNRYEPEVFVPSSFKDENGKEAMWVFKASELRYLDALHRGEDIEKAMQDAGISQKKASRLLTRKKARDYMTGLLRQKMAAEGLTQDWFLSELKGVWQGTKEVSRQQMDAIKEIGARVAPRPERSSQDFDRPIININVGMAEAAIKRQQVIEGSIIGTTANAASR